MKKLISLLLALMLALGTVSALAEAAPADEAAGLPQIGDVVYGFEAKEIREFPLIGAQLVLFEHQKTGAKLLYVAKDDTNRAFQLTFLTRPIDDTGLPHVFEHSTLSGSEKYPSTGLWFNLAYQTYNTYMNAYTTDAMTSYPIASLSEEQLLNYADFYTDSCLHPNVLNDESIYRTEAWRYHLDDMDSEMYLEGTVYTEMQGALTLSRAAMDNANRITFPGAALTYNYGGNPDNIPAMTFQDLRDYHAKFYHPSNCIAYLYGQFEDYSAFLKLLDDAFSPYEKAEFIYEETEYQPITGPVETKCAYPMAEGTDTENQSTIYYYIVCPGMKGNAEQEQLIDNLCSLLNMESSVLKQSLKNTFPTISVSCGREVAAPDDAIVFVADNVNEDDAPLFKETVDAALREVAANGFPVDMLDSAVASINISSKLAPDTADPVEGVLYNLAYNYAVTGDPFYYVDSVESMSAMKEENGGAFQACISEWLLDKETWTLTTTYPAPGQKELKDAALAAALAEIKANMSEEELQAIIEATNAEPAEDKNAAALVAQLQAVTVDSLPEEIKEYEISDVTADDGIRRIDVIAGVDGIGKTGIYLDAQTLPQEDIHWMRLFTRLIGKLDTDAHTEEELKVLMDRYLYDRTFGVDVSGTEKAYHPYLIVEWTAMDEDLAAGYDLVEELLFHTQFNDIEKLTKRISAEKASVRSTINGSPYSVMLYRGLGVDVPLWRYYSYLNHLEYYAFLDNLEQQLSENPEEVAAHLAALEQFFANNAGSISAFAGNEESIALNRSLADAFLGKLDHVEREAVEYDLPAASENEAVIVDINVQFNNVIASFDDLGLEEHDAALEAVTTLVADTYLIPILRDQMGVYTPWNGTVTRGGFYLIAYRDPNLKETFDLYQSLPELIANIEDAFADNEDAEFDQDFIDGYILNAYVNYAKPEGELAGATSAIERAINGIPQDKNLEYMRELKAVTPETVKQAAEIYQKAWDNGVHSTAGSAAAINANADMFEVVLNPFNAMDSTQVEFTDVTEDSDYYTSVRFVFENGIMQPVAEDAFGVDANATLGDLLAGIYVCFGGGPNAAEEARAWLAGYGLVDADADLEADLTEETLCFILADGIGLGISTDTPDAVVTRGDLADLLAMVYEAVNAQ